MAIAIDKEPPVGRQPIPPSNRLSPHYDYYPQSTRERFIAEWKALREAENAIGRARVAASTPKRGMI